MKKLLLETDYFIFELEDKILIGTGIIPYVDLNFVHKIVNQRLSIQHGASHPLLINIRKVKTITKEARDFLASEEGCRGVVAGAILIDSVIGSMIGNFFIRISKPLVPTRLFTNEEDDKKWLSRFSS